MTIEWILLGLRGLAVVILYSFLTIALSLIWQEARLAAKQVSHQNQPKRSENNAP